MHMHEIVMWSSARRFLGFESFDSCRIAIGRKIAVVVDVVVRQHF